MKKYLRKKYKGVSLVEMLITLVILMVVMMLVSVTLTTMIRASVISTARTTAREESEFILELLRRTIRNSHTGDIHIYNIEGRVFNSTSGITVDEQAILGYNTEVLEGATGTEIHFRPVGYGKWICVGYFKDSEDDTKGYILKSIRQDITTASSCFSSADPEYAANTIILNSSDVEINSLSLLYFYTYDDNFILTIDLDVKPTHWVAHTENLKPNYFRQAVVSTQKLTWE